jgi:hypothetical protein
MTSGNGTEALGVGWTGVRDVSSGEIESIRGRDLSGSVNGGQGLSVSNSLEAWRTSAQKFFAPC